MKLKKDVHLIKQFLVEADYYEERTANQVQELVLSIVKQKLAQILEYSCNRYVQNQLIRIKKITLDLGDIPIDELETKLPSIFEKKINQILSNINSKTASLQKEVDGIEIIEENKLILNTFTNYVKYGTVPWDLQHIIEEYSFSEVFLYLIERNEPEFKQEVYNLLELPNVRRRLVRYFDSGEMIQFFKKSLPNDFRVNILGLQKDISNLILKSGDIESAHKTYLILYLKEFVLMASARFQKSKEAFALDILTKKFIEFVSSEKDISPLKWIPAVIVKRGIPQKSNLESTIIVKVLQEYYTDYLLEEKPSFLSKKLSLTGKEQFSHWLKERQPMAIKHFLKAIDNIVKQISKYFPDIEESKLEQVVQEAASDIIPDVPIDPENLTKWIFAIEEEVKKIFGVKVKHLEIGFDIKDIEEKKDKSEIEKNIKQELEQKIDEGSDYKSEAEDVQMFEQKVFNISIARDYLSLFIKSGLLPFKKLYKDPAKELKNLFIKYLVEEEGEVRKIIREYWDELVLWRVKIAFGEEFLANFEKIVRVELEGIIPDKMEYEYLLLLNLIKTGTFPWAEIAEKGYDELILIIEKYISPELKEEFIQVLVDEEFFKHEIIIKKVFAIMPVEFGKELLNIRKELLSKGIIDLKEIIFKEYDLFEERLKRDIADELDETDLSIKSDTGDDIKEKDILKDDDGRKVEFKEKIGEKDIEEIQKDIEKGIEKSIEKDIIEVDKDNFEDEIGHKTSDGAITGDVAEVEGIQEIQDKRIGEDVSGEEMQREGEDLEIKFKDSDIKVDGERSDKDYNTEIQQSIDITEREDDVWDSRIVDRLADLIVEFSRKKFPQGISQKKQANFIFDEILKAARKALYETAAMLVSLDKVIVDALLVVFTEKQRDYIKKLVRNYRARFVSIAEEIRDSERREDEKHLISEGESGEAVFIENAGLVLLNPYIKRLFDRLALLEKNRFKSDEAREKAALILQYLVKKDDKPAEFELPLNKIIVGMPLFTPFKFEIIITEEEKELCDQLLDAVVKNWGALRNTSRDGLRTSFLMRNGRLKKEGSGWRLHVEKKTYDILMSKLPWGYTMVQLPWMEKPLYTEWED